MFFLRRIFIAALAAFIIFPAPSFSAITSSDFINDFGQKLITIINAPISLEQKEPKLNALINKNVDINNIGRYCLGRYWRTTTAPQKEKYLKLFHQVVLNGVTRQIGNFKHVSFKITSTSSDAVGDKISLQLLRPGQPIVNGIAVVEKNPYKIIDLYAEGVSLRLTQKNEYQAFLIQHNGDVQTLIDALAKKLAQH